MLKVTLKLVFYCVIIFAAACKETEKRPSELELLHVQDSVSEARIDSAYLSIKSNCDTLMSKQVPQMVDSFLKDSVLIQKFFSPGKVYTDADKKVESVVRQLQAECDSNLQKETYRIARLRQKLKPVRHKKLKA